MMIYKEPGNVKIHHFRVIHLYKADQSLLWELNGEKGCEQPSMRKHYILVNTEGFLAVRARP